MTFLNVREAATYIRLSRGYLHELVQRSEIPYSRIGKRIVFNTDALDTWVLSRQVVKPAIKRIRAA
jgi:excisionase family DNA binding protein